MNKYHTYIVDRKAETLITLETNSSFEARKYLASVHGVNVFDCVAVRIWSGPEAEYNRDLILRINNRQVGGGMRFRG